MMSASNQVDDQAVFLLNISEEHDQLLTFHEYFESTHEYYLILALHRLVPPVIVSFNCIGSAFTLAAIWRSSVRQHPTLVYQTAWIIANCLTVVLGCGLDWATHMAEQPSINGIADWSCRVWQALFGVVRYTGGWMVVTMLVERYMMSKRSQLVKDYCSTCYVKTIIVSILVLLHVVNVHSMWIYELLPSNQCGIDHRRRDFEAVVWPWISATVNVYLPLVVSAVLAIVLAVGPRHPLATLSPANDLEQFDVDDVQLSRVCVAIGLFYVMATTPSIALNFVEYFLPGWPAPFGDRSRFYLAAYICRLVANAYEACGHLLTLIGIFPIRSAAIDMICCRRWRTFNMQSGPRRVTVTQVSHSDNCAIEDTTL